MQPVMKEKCATCPFRKGSPHAHLTAHLIESCLTERNRICHSTGNSVFYGETGVEEHVCRGTRDIQLRVFTSLGVLSEPTDECWEATLKEMTDADSRS